MQKAVNKNTFLHEAHKTAFTSLLILFILLFTAASNMCITFCGMYEEYSGCCGMENCSTSQDDDLSDEVHHDFSKCFICEEKLKEEYDSYNFIFKSDSFYIADFSSVSFYYRESKILSYFKSDHKDFILSFRIIS